MLVASRMSTNVTCMPGTPAGTCAAVASTGTTADGVREFVSLEL
jgi:hypothetical protein